MTNLRSRRPSRKPHAQPQHKQMQYSHTHLVHTSVRASPLSKESPEQNYRGFFNLAMLVLAVSNIRLIIENLIKYGLLIRAPMTKMKKNDFFWVVLSFVFQCVPILVAFAVEASAAGIHKHSTAPQPKHARTVALLHAVNIALAIIVPTYISWSLIWHPVASAVPLFFATVLFLKLISYALVNADLRFESTQASSAPLVQDSDSGSPHPLTDEKPPKFDPTSTPYPTNITIPNLLYFIAAPTLCYQPVYPHTSCIRTTFLLKRFLELSVSLFGMYFLIIQYASPTLRNSINAMTNLDIMLLIERILKLSVVSVVVWLLMFWSLFHCWLNILAEILCFGDRRFYQPWWNARDISEYWRLWNTPVYNWGKRHIYLPLILKHRVHPALASTMVFMVSAVLHEVLVGVPTRCLNGVAFWGMMGQVPLILIINTTLQTLKSMFIDTKSPAATSPTSQTDKDKEKRDKGEKVNQVFDTIGNYMFWVTFTVVGQPMCVMVYYWQWYKNNGAGMS